MTERNPKGSGPTNPLLEPLGPWPVVLLRTDHQTNPSASEPSQLGKHAT
jgi:hypothetical protein